VLAGLLDAGLAYRSTATADDVRAYKDEHGADRGFRGHDDGEGAVRLRVPDGASVVHDAIRGDTRFEHTHLDDPVIARADGSVLYNFAVAVDDHDAAITHVVRGEDHLSNTPKQLLVLAAMGAAPPIYAHLPLLHGPDGKKLSKRHGAASVQELRDQGYLPEAIRNYLALLGWGTDDDETLLDTAELQRRFRLDRVSKSPAIFDEKKLRWMNGRYLRELNLEDLTARLEAFTGRDGLGPAVEISREKIQTLADFWPLVGFVFDGPADDPSAWEKTIGAEGGVETLTDVRAALAVTEPFEVGTVETALRAIVDRRGVKPKAVFQPLRVAMAGTTVSPGIFETAVLLGRDETLRRIDVALDRAAAGRD
jgi:glutamyl-tRNA synthetase